MKAFLLAAGKGTRMGALTRQRPKPLVPANGRPLIDYQLQALAAAGFREVVVNTARFGDQIATHLGTGTGFGLEVTFSHEGEEPMETGGGIWQALPLLGPGPFAIINADVFTDFDYAALPSEPPSLAHLVLVPNPPHNERGDFSLTADGQVGMDGPDRYTYSGIAVLRPELFAEAGPGRYPLAPLLRHAATQGLVSGCVHRGYWLDVGTPERLASLEHWLSVNN